MIAVLYYCCMRVSEVVALDVEHVMDSIDPNVPERKALFIARSKTDQFGRGKTVPLPPNAERRLTAWLRAANLTSGPIFVGLASNQYDGPPTPSGRRLGRSWAGGVVKHRGNRAGFRVTSHSFRRSMAGVLTARGKSIQQVQDIGRWKTPAMVLRYAERGIASKSFMYDEFSTEDERKLSVVG